MPLGSILSELNEVDKKKTVEKQTRSSILDLTRKKVKLDITESALVDDINGGKVSFVQNRRADKEELTKAQMKNIFKMVKTKQKLEALAYVNGITCSKEDGETMLYTFDPYIRGVPKGTYCLRMVPSRGKLLLLGHTLPSAVPVGTLYESYVADQQDPTKDVTKLLPNFLKEIFRFLRAFLSRQDQVKELEESGELGDNVSSITALDNYTSLKIVLTVSEKDVEQANLQATISLLYAEDGERPIPGSLKVVTNMDVDVEALEDQCHKFYQHRLKDAIIKSF